MNATIKALRDNLAAGLYGKAFWGSGDWVDSSRPGNRYISDRYTFEPQTSINYDALVGDLWQNSAVQACINAVQRAWPESYPCVKEEDASGKKVKVQDHPLNDLLQWPNPVYDDTVLWAGTILSYWVDGNAYWGINRAKNGDVGEFVYIPHDLITPKRLPDSTSIGPDYFEYRPKGTPIPIDPRNIVHFRFGIDPYYPLCGLSGWASVRRHVFTDNEGINYVAVTLYRRGSAWMILTPESADATIDDPEGFIRKFEAKVARDNRGSIAYIDGGLKSITPPTLKDQAADTLHRIPETRICALAGLPAIWVGLASGLERSTFENTEQATKAAWNTIVAVQRMMGRQLTQQVLRRPLYDSKPNFYDWERANRNRSVWAGFDYSEVRALQPDKQEEWERIGKAYERGLLEDDEARIEMGYKPYTASQRAAQLPPAPKPSEPMMETEEEDASSNGGSAKPSKNGNGARKSQDWAERIASELDTLHGASV